MNAVTIHSGSAVRQEVKWKVSNNNSWSCLYQHQARVQSYPSAKSDHLSLLHSPAYTPLRRSARPTTKTVTTWPDNALFKLQDCFIKTDWDLFEHQELETFTGTVLDYIQFCIGNVTVDKNIRAFPNQKPRMASQVRQGPQCCLQVRWQSSIQSCSSWPEKGNKKSQGGPTGCT